MQHLTDLKSEVPFVKNSNACGILAFAHEKLFPAEIFFVERNGWIVLCGNECTIFHFVQQICFMDVT